MDYSWEALWQEEENVLLSKILHKAVFFNSNYKAYAMEINE